MDKSPINRKAISIVVPTRNEAGNVRALVERIDAALKGEFAYEMIFIDDRSTDGTLEILQDLQEHYPIRAQLKKGHMGKAHSLLEGFDLVTHPVVAMIDADLQYPPEALPDMAGMLEPGVDVVVANRSEQDISWYRKFISWGFSFVFGRLLHGLSVDVQSGLKVFRKQILSEIKIHPSPWTFDLEFLTQARNAGYRITSYDIVFSDRTAGESKVNLRQAIFEIGANAVKTKLKGYTPGTIQSESADTMRGAGLAHKKKRFITHTNLPHEFSALVTFVFWQKLFIAGLFLAIAIGLWLNPLLAVEVIVAVMSFIYFADVLFNLYLVSKSLNRPPELKFREKDLANLEPTALPVYSILCPLYREAHVLPGFIQAIENLDWPKNKLDVMLLLEADDESTIAAAEEMNLPEYVRIVVVPHSLPKTKPKACNYGLTMARGEYLVVYDAEDIPEPAQLKKAFLGFQKVPEHIKCLQAKLNYFNPNHNWLTRMFTAEYSLWFDLILPGLQSINAYIPLGGTSNHFRTRDLIELAGWDPFNVTEDCDLGARLFKRGFATAVIDSVTLEEANSNFKNWLRQRSRWIKGYMQTYLVHMREPIAFFRKSPIDALIFQLVVGGKIAFLLINPIFWLATIVYFVFRSIVGPTYAAIYPDLVLYIAVTSLVFGNFLYLYYYMIACAKRGQLSLIKYIFLVPVYWLMASVASLIALYQLFVKPHYWEKTNHGLHLAKHPIVESDISEPVSAEGFAFSKIVNKFSPHLLSGGSVLLSAVFLANVFNFIFNAVLGRLLSLEQLAIVILVNTVWSLVGLFFTAAGTTVNHRTAYLVAEGQMAEAQSLRRRALYRGLTIILGLSALWIIATPFISNFFNLSDPWTILLFVPMFSFSFIALINTGFLQGQIKLGQVALVYLVESFSKLIAAGVLVWAGFSQQAYMSIPISVVVVSLFTMYLYRRSATKVIRSGTPENFPSVFYISALFSGLSVTVFMNLDVLLVNHFLPTIISGEYSFLSLVGKMVFFFGSLPSSLIITFVSRDLGANKNPSRTFYLLLGVTGVFVGAASLILGLFGNWIVPFLLGSHTVAILPYVPAYVLAMAIFTIASSFVAFHLALKQYIFPFISLLMSVLMASLIVINHGTVGAVVFDILCSSASGLGLLILMHFSHSSLRFARNLFRDLFGVFVPIQKLPLAPGQKRILIFNWRDTKHSFAGGAEVYIHEMAKRWVAEGNAVTVFSGNDSHSPRTEIVDGVLVVRRGGFYFVYFWALVYYFLQFRKKYDVIIDCQNGVPFFTPLYAKEQIYCLMHHVHQDVFTRSLSGPLAMFARFLEKDLMPIVYRNVKFVTISQSSKQDILALGLGRAGISVVNPGINLEELTLGEKSDHPTVVYLGRLKAYKSVDVLIKAFFIVLSKLKNAELIIAGSGEEEANLRKLVTKMDLDDSVSFVGKISDQGKTTLLQRAWVFVNPSFMEGWGITTVEANACGTPIVAANVPGLRDSVLNPHTGYLVKHGDYAAFAEKILKLLEDDDLRERMGVDAREWAEKFDWSKTSEQFFSILTPEYVTPHNSGKHYER